MHLTKAVRALGTAIHSGKPASVRRLVCGKCAQRRAHILAEQHDTHSRDHHFAWLRVWRCLHCGEEHDTFGQVAMLALQTFDEPILRIGGESASDLGKGAP